MPCWPLVRVVEWLPCTELKSGVKSLLSIFEPLSLLIKRKSNVLPTSSRGGYTEK